MDLAELFDLAEHGPDTFVGRGPKYPWGGLYGGQIVAQALHAAARSVDEGFQVHSLRAFFIRRGDHAETVRYEVDRTRNGRSFCTRRVIARQAVGAILNLEASFQRPELSESVAPIAMDPDIPGPDDLEQAAWTELFDRRSIPRSTFTHPRDGAGRSAAWMRALADLGEDPLMAACAFAYLSDDLPTEAVIAAHPVAVEPSEVLASVLFSASLDHTIWFHAPFRSDRWHLHDFTCHHFAGGRGLTLGHVFDQEGRHVATVAQEVLLRDNRVAEKGQTAT